MEKNITKLDGCYEEMEIMLNREELEPYYQDALRKAQPHIAIQGFRKGKVPMNMVKKLFGKQIESDAHQDIISDVFAKIVNEDRIRVIGQPELHDIKLGDNKELTFVVKYEIIPEVELADYKSLIIDEPVHVVTDDEIQSQLDLIATQYAAFDIDNSIKDEMYVVGIETLELDKSSKKPIDNAQAEHNHVFLKDERNLDPKLKNLLIGKNSEDVFEYQIGDETDENNESPLLQVTVNEIQKVIPAELNDEFIKDFSQGKFDNLNDFKEDIGFKLQEEWDTKSRQAMEDQIINKLVEMHPDVIAPEAAIGIASEDLLNNLKRQYGNNKELESLTIDSEIGQSLRPIAERNVKWELIRNQIIKNENLQVEDFDIDPIIDAEVQRTQANPDALRANLMKNENFLASILAKKAMDLILEFCETNQVDFELNQNMNDEDDFEYYDDEDHDHDHHDHNHHDHKH